MPTQPSSLYITWERGCFGVVLPGESMPAPGRVPPGEVRIERVQDGGFVYLWSYYNASSRELCAPVRQNPCSSQEAAIEAALRYLDKTHPGWVPVRNVGL